jgi:nitroreductase
MTVVNLNANEVRTASIEGVEPVFTGRWSPRAMTGEALSFNEVAPLFEAARWAPSSMNAQPWRFVYALKDDSYWDDFFELLVDANKGWAKDAGALVIVVSRRLFEFNEKESVTHSFDAGAAWMSLALQAKFSGLVAHGMGGFDYEQARKTLALPEEFQVEAMVALGKPGRVEDLAEGYRERENPSQRKPLDDIVFNGKLAEINT